LAVLFAAPWGGSAGFLASVAGRSRGDCETRENAAGSALAQVQPYQKRVITRNTSTKQGVVVRVMDVRLHRLSSLL